MHAIIIVVLLLSYLGHSASAQEYLFSVPRVELDVYVKSDGSALLSYNMDFQNTKGGHSIDVIDVGLPNEDFDLSSAEAYLDGTRITNMRASEIVHPGLEVHLTDKTIPAGGSGTFQFSIVVRNLIFQDTTRGDYASLQITPTWFGEEYVSGTSQTAIRIHLPQGVNPEEVLYQDVPFTGKDVPAGGVVVRWEKERRLTGSYRVGVSFPKRAVNRVITMTKTELLMRWYQGTFSEGAQTILIFGSIVLVGVVFFRFTGGTGSCIFFPLFIGLLILQVVYEPARIYVWPVILVFGVALETSLYRRKTRYLPAIADVEGAGIKRGLTAPEAAVLLELPIKKVITMILFGMMKKGLIRQTKKDPVSFSLEKRPADVVVQPYENQVLAVLKKKAGVPIDQHDFSKVAGKLIASVTEKMSGFDLDETREYYKQIIARAWKEASEIGDLETWQKNMDEKIDWMMVDSDFDDRFSPYRTRYVPRSFRESAVVTTGELRSPTSAVGAPRFSDVAASVSGWFQNTADKVVGTVEGKKGGLLDLSGLDRAMASRSGKGGGGGSSCACAGCACACACAGGGR